jgi:hypothetical protein
MRCHGQHLRYSLVCNPRDTPQEVRGGNGGPTPEARPNLPTASTSPWQGHHHPQDCSEMCPRNTSADSWGDSKRTPVCGKHQGILRVIIMEAEPDLARSCQNASNAFGDPERPCIRATWHSTPSSSYMTSYTPKEVVRCGNTMTAGLSSYVSSAGWESAKDVY